MERAVPNRTLLIVDDEVELCELLGEIAQPLASTILYAHNGEDALKMVREQSKEAPIDAILSDINMPRKSGVSLLTDLRAEGELVPFIFLTGYGDKEKVATAIRLGAFDFFDKPVNNKALYNRLNQALDFGVELRSFGEEIEAMMIRAPEGVTLTKDLKDALEAVLLIRKQRIAYFKKPA